MPWPAPATATDSVDQRLALRRVRDQSLHPARDHVARGLVAADEDQQQLGDQLVEREGVTFAVVGHDLRLRQDRGEVVARVGAAILDHFGDVRTEICELRDDLIE